MVSVGFDGAGGLTDRAGLIEFCALVVCSFRGGQWAYRNRQQRPMRLHSVGALVVQTFASSSCCVLALSVCLYCVCASGLLSSPHRPAPFQLGLRTAHPQGPFVSDEVVSAATRRWSRLRTPPPRSLEHRGRPTIREETSCSGLAAKRMLEVSCGSADVGESGPRCPKAVCVCVCVRRNRCRQHQSCLMIEQ